VATQEVLLMNGLPESKWSKFADKYKNLNPHSNDEKELRGKVAHVSSSQKLPLLLFALVCTLLLDQLLHTFSGRRKATQQVARPRSSTV
jgi:hypothetical protein